MILLQSAGPDLGLAVPAQVILSILPIVAVAFCAILLFFYLLWDFKKKKLIIEKGMEPNRTKTYENLLLIGIVAFFIGLGLLIFYALYNGLHSSLLSGIIPTSAGLGILIYYGIYTKKRR